MERLKLSTLPHVHIWEASHMGWMFCECCGEFKEMPKETVREAFQ